MGFIGLPELLVLAVVVLLLFGRKRLPELGGSMRSAAIGFKRGITGATPKDIIEGSAEDVTRAHDGDRDYAASTTSSTTATSERQ